jgi:hypothetical protein
LIDPADRVDGRSGGRLEGKARHRLRHGDHQEIEHAVRTRKHRRIDEISGARDVRTAEQGRTNGRHAYRSTTNASRLRNDE